MDDDERWRNASVNGSASDWPPTEANSTAFGPVMVFRWTSAGITASQYVQTVVYWLIFIVGVPGNLLVLAVVIWKLSMSAEHHAMSIFAACCFVDFTTELYRCPIIYTT